MTATDAEHARRVIAHLRPAGEPEPGASPFLTVDDAAALLGIGARKLYDLLKLRDPQTGRPVVPHVRQGESYVLHKAELLTFLERGRAGLWDAAAPGQLRPDAVERLAEEVLDRVLELIVQAKRQGRR